MFKLIRFFVVHILFSVCMSFFDLYISSEICSNPIYLYFYLGLLYAVNAS